MKQASWKQQKQQILKDLNDHMDFLLIGSVVTYKHKCCKSCRCNQGKGHPGHYLSANINGKTKNLYLNKEAVDQARLMTQSYSEVKTLLKQLSEVNYRLLREKNRVPVAVKLANNPVSKSGQVSSSNRTHRPMIIKRQSKSNSMTLKENHQ